MLTLYYRIIRAQDWWIFCGGSIFTLIMFGVIYYYLG